MDISYLIGESVNHITYGRGLIKTIEEDYLYIIFDNEKESKFSFPLCFDKFVKLADDNKQQEICQYVAKWKKDNGIIQQEKLHNMTAKRQEGIKKREEERKIRRIQREKEVAARNKMFQSSL